MPRKPSHKTNPHLIDLIRQLKELDEKDPLQFIIMTENMLNGNTEVYSTYKNNDDMLELIDQCFETLLQYYENES